MNIYHRLVGLKSRRSYGSTSAFADWIRARVHSEKPGAATLDEWADWREDNQKNHPIVHWITETLLDNLQDIVLFPHDVYRNFSFKLRNRFLTKTHMLPTNLPPGEWYEYATRMEEALFTVLVNFVEIDKADSQSFVSNNTIKQTPRESGLAYLDWEIGLESEESDQSLAAQEIKDLYLWIKDIYPNRRDPMDAARYSPQLNTGFQQKKSVEERQATSAMFAKVTIIENEYRAEDTEILCRIIKIRKQLWS